VTAAKASGRSLASPRDTSRKPASVRKQHRAQGLPEGWHALCVTMPEAALIALDEKLDQIRAAGVLRMSRSRLVRIALSLVDVDAAIDAARRERKT
jgi:hypothetical protein